MEWLAVLQGIALLATGATAAWDDLSGHPIRNSVWLGGLATGLLFSALRGGMTAPTIAEVSGASSAIAAGGGFALFFLFYWTRGISGGDVKLMTALCALGATPWFALSLIVYTAFAGAPVAMIYLYRERQLTGGIKRSVGAMVRWRYDRGDEEADPHPTGESTDPAQAPPRIFVPYSLAMCLGTIFALILHRGPLPVF